MLEMIKKFSIEFIKFILKLLITMIIMFFMLFIVYLLIIEFSIDGLEQLKFELLKLNKLPKALLFVFSSGILFSSSIDIFKLIEKKIIKNKYLKFEHLCLVTDNTFREIRRKL